MTEPRSCWPVLLNKAQEEVNRIQAELQLLRQRAQGLQDTRSRLLKLYADYQKPSQSGSTSAGMQETMNRRQFAAQLLTLVDRVEQDIAHIERAQAGVRQRLALAEKERLKMQALLEQDQLKVRQSAVKREQRQMDELGVMQFNLGAGA